MKTALMCSSLLLIFLVFGCKNDTSYNNTQNDSLYIREASFVDVLFLNKETFHQELISNGKLTAWNKSDLKFRVDGELKNLYISNGGTVNVGQTIAVLNQIPYIQKIEFNKININKATIALQDLLLERGYSLSDSSSIPKDILRAAQIKSNYIGARHDLGLAEYNFQQSMLIAPFSGKVIDVGFREHESISSSEIFCTVIDDSQFDVEFSLVESEIPFVKVGDRISVSPLSLMDIQVFGYISEVNPSIDSKGLVRIKGRIKNAEGRLITGMNVSVKVVHDIPNQFIVPKASVIMRQNKQVLFKYVNGKAVWVYVNVLFENASSYAIIQTPIKGNVLNEGDSIIISNNLSLSHLTDVVLSTPKH